MSAKRVLLGLVLLDFLGLTVWAVWRGGWQGTLTTLSTPIGALVAVDLALALGMALMWMWRDARRRGVNPVPYAVMTLLTGSAGPLLYLVRHPEPPART